MIAARCCYKLEELDVSEWIDFDVIGIDEGQFFEDLVDFAEKAANHSKVIIVSALSNDYKKQAWPSIAQLMPICEKVKHLQSICKMCGTNASFTFKTVSGSHSNPQSQSSTSENEGSKKILIGGTEIYMPLCRECFNERT